MNIAIVGGRSLLKKELQEKLDQGVLELSSDHSPTTIKKEIFCDFQDVVACEKYLNGVDCVVYSGLEWRGMKPDEVYNQIADLGCIVNEALKSNIRIILISDALSMGYHKNVDLYDESKAWNQTIKWSFSGFMYHLAEREIARGIAEGLVGVTLRPSIMIGSEEDREVIQSLNSSLKRTKQHEECTLSIVSRLDVMSLITKLIGQERFEHPVVNCSGHIIAAKEFAALISNREKSNQRSNWLDTLRAKFSKESSASPLDRPLGISLNYNNQRSIDWASIVYSKLESTLLDFQS